MKLRTTSEGYIYDRRFFLGGFFIIVMVFFLFALSEDFNFKNKVYATCKDPKGCPNPYFEMECSKPWLYGDDCYTECMGEWCNQEILEPGVYGDQPPKLLIPGFISLIISIIILAFVGNHKLHNEGRAFHFEVVLTDRQKKILRKFK